MEGRYDFKKIEAKWQRFWEENGFYLVEEDPYKPKYYCLEMFPYPSGALHMGHIRNYAIGDVVARFKSMQGFNVLHQWMGCIWFTGRKCSHQAWYPPVKWTYANIENMRKQLQTLGISYDWNRRLLPAINLRSALPAPLSHGSGLQREAAGARRVLPFWPMSRWWTVPANDVNTVERRNLEQWFFKITCDRLLNDLISFPVGLLVHAATDWTQ